MEYRPRIVDGTLREALSVVGAIVIEGPRACGKTETGRRVARSEIRMDTLASRQAFSIAPELVLEGEAPRLIDEWQVERELWNHVRHAVDDRKAKGQFILTGSAVPPDDPARHTGAGRFIHLRMRPMTLAETGHSNGRVSFADILRGGSVAAPEPGITIRDIAERIVIGGWPTNLGLTASQALRALQGYVEDVCRVDVPRLDGVRRDPDGVRRLMMSLARNIATRATLETLTGDANGSDGRFATDTVGVYLGALRQLMIADDVPPWKPALRSATRLRGKAVRHLADPSLATAALGADPARLLREISWFGLLFESLVIRDLRVYAEALGGRVFHYHDSNDLEVDAIVEMQNGRWAGFEVKLGSSPAVVETAATALRKVRDRVAGEPPLALVVITGTGYALTLPDGVLQVPIGTLAA